MADPAPIAQICPRCGYRAISTSDGWCAECSSERLVEAYDAKDRERVEQRRLKWRTRTRALSDAAPATRERQRSHRLRVAITPKEPPHPSIDPWEIGFAGLQALNRVEKSMTGTRAREALESARECMKQLASGPADG